VAAGSKHGECQIEKDVDRRPAFIGFMVARALDS
jgi:hypothetical protein